MRVVHVSRFASGDGAANAAHRLHRALLRLKIDSIMYVAEARDEAVAADPTITLFRPPSDLRSRLRRRLRRIQLARSLARYGPSRPAGYEAFSDDRSPHGGDWLGQLPSGDVINIHAMYHFLDYEAFFASVPARAPVVRTLHDMNFFTGGCHVPAGCEKYTERCGECPQLGSHEPEDLSRQIWRRKASALRDVDRDRLHVIAPSRWLANHARRSTLLRRFRVSVIPFGVDSDVFRPRDKAVARDTLGIPQDARCVLFVADPITRPVKRFSTLVAALNGLRGVDNLHLIAVGSGAPESPVRVPYLNLGRIDNERLLSLVYSAADVLVLPSLQESFGLVVLEAMACGTPAIGSPVGGMPDMVRPGVTGQLFTIEDVESLRAAIREVLQDPVRHAAMSVNCRRVAVDEYSLELHARRYIALYESLIAGREAPAELDLDGPTESSAAGERLSQVV